MRAPIRWWISLPFILALLTIGFLGWSVSKTLTLPHDGIRSISSTGLIIELEPAGPAAGYLQVGDEIVSVNGVPFIDANPMYVGSNSGDEVHMLVKRNGQTISVQFKTIKPPTNEIMSRLVILLVA